MSTLAFWEVANKFFLLFKNRVQFPYTVAVHQQQVGLRHLSLAQKFRLKASSIFLLANTVYCFGCLCWCYTQRRAKQQLRIETILLTVLQLFLSSCFMTIHFVISFRPEVPLLILNTMARLETRVKGKRLIYFNNYPIL